MFSLSFVRENWIFLGSELNWIWRHQLNYNKHFSLFLLHLMEKKIFEQMFSNYCNLVKSGFLALISIFIELGSDWLTVAAPLNLNHVCWFDDFHFLLPTGWIGQSQSEWSKWEKMFWKIQQFWGQASPTKSNL